MTRKHCLAVGMDDHLAKPIDRQALAKALKTWVPSDGAPASAAAESADSPADAPRDFDFLYSGNRLNVAISRARGLAVLVCSPELLDVSPRTPEQLRLANALCRLVEVALEQDGETQEQIAQTGASGDGSNCGRCSTTTSNSRRGSQGAREQTR